MNPCAICESLKWEDAGHSPDCYVGMLEKQRTTLLEQNKALLQLNEPENIKRWGQKKRFDEDQLRIKSLVAERDRYKKALDTISHMVLVGITREGTSECKIRIQGVAQSALAPEKK